MAAPVFRPVRTGGFVHPGIVNSAASLETMQLRAAAGVPATLAAVEKLRASRYARLSWSARPVASVACGSGANVGCAAETDDAQAAYTHALLWTLIGDPRHAARAIEILNGWSAVLTEHRFDTRQHENGLLQAAWGAQTFTKAAELIRYSGAGWAADDIARFASMLRTAFLPRVRDGWKAGASNWQLSMAEATINIGVFLDDQAVFADGIGDWREQTRAHIVSDSDGIRPLVPANTTVTEAYLATYWKNPRRWVPGLSQETCRDLSHAAMFFAAALAGAETARIQGMDLFDEESERLRTGMEFHARTLNAMAQGQTPADWPGRDAPKLGGTAWALTWAVGLNHYQGRLGYPMPHSEALLERIRPTGTGLHMNWETLTHGPNRPA
ncbi:alginate lyase family protein [Kineococcus gynurae]|uniref:Alginate lyase family protein n=1 Tax=Kineococcus gynurae TaxID=452979 RepID=A0ABV5LWZ1_9ACTN